MITVQPLTQIFADSNYAWQLLEAEIKIDADQDMTGEDVSNLLHLYMRGVQKMNSLLDARESFFKNKVTSLMSRSSVIRIFNKPMVKKKKPDEIEICNPKVALDIKTERQLKQKRRQIEMRMAYGAQEHNPDALRKLMAEQINKQAYLAVQISKIVDSHQERLIKRIQERKLKTLKARSRSEISINNNWEIEEHIQENNSWIEKSQEGKQFGGSIVKQQNNGENKNRYCKSLSLCRTRTSQECETPPRRRISIDFSSPIPFEQ